MLPEPPPFSILLKRDPKSSKPKRIQHCYTSMSIHFQMSLAMMFVQREYAKDYIKNIDIAGIACDITSSYPDLHTS